MKESSISEVMLLFQLKFNFNEKNTKKFGEKMRYGKLPYLNILIICHALNYSI